MVCSFGGAFFREVGSAPDLAGENCFNPLPAGDNCFNPTSAGEAAPDLAGENCFNPTPTSRGRTASIQSRGGRADTILPQLSRGGADKPPTSGGTLVEENFLRCGGRGETSRCGGRGELFTRKEMY